MGYGYRGRDKQPPESVRPNPAPPIRTIQTTPTPPAAAGGGAVVPGDISMVASPRLLGRTTAGAGGAEEISAGTGLSLAAGVLTAPAREHFMISINGSQSGNTTFTSAPAALSELSAPRWRAHADLTNCTQARLISNVMTIGSAGTKLRIQYSTDGASWVYLDNVSGPEVALDSLGHAVSAWIALTAGAKADAWLRWVTIGGDGVASPAVGMTHLEVRT